MPDSGLRDVETRPGALQPGVLGVERPGVQAPAKPQPGGAPAPTVGVESELSALPPHEATKRLLGRLGKAEPGDRDAALAELQALLSKIEGGRDRLRVRVALMYALAEFGEARVAISFAEQFFRSAIHITMAGRSTDSLHARGVFASDVRVDEDPGTRCCLWLDLANAAQSMGTWTPAEGREAAADKFVAALRRQLASLPPAAREAESLVALLELNADIATQRVRGGRAVHQRAAQYLQEYCSGDAPEDYLCAAVRRRFQAHK